MSDTLLDRIGWYLDAVSSQCKTCLRRGTTCDNCIVQPAGRLAEEFAAARNAKWIKFEQPPKPQDGREVQGQIARLRGGIVTMLKDREGRWTTGKEIHGYMTALGFSGTQITRGIAAVVRKGDIEAKGRTSTRIYRWRKECNDQDEN